MRFNYQQYLENCENYIQNAPQFYGIQFVQSGVESQDVKALLMWLRRLSEKQELSFLLCDSTTEHACSRAVIRTGKRGRPRTKVIGDSAVRHVHGMIGSSDSEIDIKDLQKTTSEYLKARQKKRKNLKQRKVSKVTDMFYPKYIHKQADHEYSAGDFDFEYFYSEWYYRPYENE